MLFSITKLNKNKTTDIINETSNITKIYYQQNNLIIENVDKYILTLNDIAKIYLIKYNIISSKYYNNYDNLSKYFFVDNNLLIYNDIINNNNIKNFIYLLKIINDKYIDNIYKELKDVCFLDIINFFLELINYLTKRVSSYNLEKKNLLECLYILSYKCCELTNMVNEYNNNLQSTINKLYNSLENELSISIN